MALLPEPLPEEQFPTTTQQPSGPTAKPPPPKEKTGFLTRKIGKKAIIPLIALLVLITIGFASFILLANREGGVVTTVGGRKITKQDLANFDRIYNAVGRYQQKVATTSVQLASHEEVLKNLVDQTLIEIEAEKRRIKVTDEEINARKKPQAEKTLSLYGWSEKDYEQSIKNKILKEKLEDALTTWREAEFIAIRFDTLPTGHVDITILEPKAKEFLEQVKNDFSQGKNVSEITQNLRKNEDYLKNFVDPASIQEKPLPQDPRLRIEERIRDPLPRTIDEQIIKMTVPTRAEIRCIAAACYLIRVMAGNDGSYQSLDQWLKEQKP